MRGCGCRRRDAGCERCWGLGVRRQGVSDDGRRRDRKSWRCRHVGRGDHRVGQRQRGGWLFGHDVLRQRAIGTGSGQRCSVVRLRVLDCIGLPGRFGRSDRGLKGRLDRRRERDWRVLQRCCRFGNGQRSGQRLSFFRPGCRVRLYVRFGIRYWCADWLGSVGCGGRLDRRRRGLCDHRRAVRLLLDRGSIDRRWACRRGVRARCGGRCLRLRRGGRVLRFLGPGVRCYRCRCDARIFGGGVRQGCRHRAGGRHGRRSGLRLVRLVRRGWRLSALLRPRRLNGRRRKRSGRRRRRSIWNRGHGVGRGRHGFCG